MAGTEKTKIEAKLKVFEKFQTNFSFFVPDFSEGFCKFFLFYEEIFYFYFARIILFLFRIANGIMGSAIEFLIIFYSQTEAPFCKNRNSRIFFEKILISVFALFSSFRYSFK